MAGKYIKKKRILLVDDDRNFNIILTGKLMRTGFEVSNAHSVKSAIDIVNKVEKPFNLALIDIFIPEYSQEVEYTGLNLGGLILADELTRISPRTKLIGITNNPGEVGEGIRSKFDEYIVKPLRDDDMLEIAKKFLSKTKKGKPNIFIVHGHDNEMKLELKNFLQNTLNLGKSKILHELPSLGRTIIEKFEEETRHVDLVFVLLTPDDKVAEAKNTNDEKRRARQNVIFELGYFFAKLQRTSGRIILLSKGGLELPSDISGIIYIDISNGIEAAGEEIRREIADWL